MTTSANYLGQDLWNQWDYAKLLICICSRFGHTERYREANVFSAPPPLHSSCEENEATRHMGGSDTRQIQTQVLILIMVIQA